MATRLPVCARLKERLPVPRVSLPKQMAAQPLNPPRLYDGLVPILIRTYRAGCWRMAAAGDIKTKHNVPETAPDDLSSRYIWAEADPSRCIGNRFATHLNEYCTRSFVNRTSEP